MKTLTGFVVLALLVPVLGSAEERFPPQAGTRVRISAPRYYLFREAAVMNESNRFDFSATLEADGANVRMPYSDLLRMETYRGETRLTLFGAVGGAVLGGVIGAATSPVPGIHDEDPFRPPRDDSFSRFMVGALIGGAAGAIFGSSVRVDRWEPVFTARRRFP